jgi:hypothetical protein
MFKLATFVWVRDQAGCLLDWIASLEKTDTNPSKLPPVLIGVPLIRYVITSPMESTS